MEYNKYDYWLEMAQYDFETAIAMLKAKRFLYVGFMLHQTIEKAFKAYYVYLKDEIPPFTHSLLKLSQNGGFYNNIPEALKDIIDILEPLNIEARYPSKKDQLFIELTEKRCEKILSETEVLYRWIIDKFTTESTDL